jgi:excinuclease UvrABC nuclease subunit
MEDWTSLYRFYDSDDVLLYVGFAKYPGKREQQHWQSSSWRSARWTRYVAYRTDEWFTNAAEAAHAERVAIATEAPAFNRLGVTRADQQAREGGYLASVAGW